MAAAQPRCCALSIGCMTAFTNPLSAVRTMQRSDLPRVLAWRNHADVRRYMYTQHDITLSEHQHWFERAEQDTGKSLLIFEINHRPLGFISVCRRPAGAVADWGFYLAPDAPGGAGRLLGQTAITYAFVQLELRKLCGEALAFNERSIRFHASLGFTQEGISRDQYFDGTRYHNVIHFGLLSHEWPPKLDLI